MGSTKGRKFQAKWAKKCLEQRKKGRRIGFNPSLYNCNADYGNSDVVCFTKEDIAEYGSTLTSAPTSTIIT